MPLIYPSRGNRMGPTSVGPPPTQPQQVEDPVRCYSCPDYDSDYLVTARIPNEDSFERKAADIVSFLHSYSLNAKKARDNTVKKKWLDTGIFQNPDSVIYKQLLEEDSTDSDYEPTEADLRQWLKLHKKRKRLIKKLEKSTQDSENGTNKLASKYKYKSWGVLNRCEPLILEADFDEIKDQLRLNIRPDEVEAVLNSERKIKKRFAGAHVSRGSSAHQWGLLSSSSSDVDDSRIAEHSENNSDSNSEDEANTFPAAAAETPAVLEVSKKNVRRKKEKTPQQLALEAAAKRRKLWVEISKKDVHRAFKSNQNSRKDTLQLCKRLAVGCMREIRKKALISQKVSRETASRSRRLCREMQAYWKRYERAEKDQRKRAEKEALEQLKVDAERREAKRQQRKLNFLITQTELYAHFMSRKKAGDQILQDQATRDILEKLDEGLDANNDDEVCAQRMKSEALGNARNAFLAHKQETDNFDVELGMPSQPPNNFDDHEDLPQPRMFQGKLKCYQLKGMSWLYGLYDRGINGILADEMGLGKTVQTVAFLSVLVERQSIWGPFLIIAPASTLHNWQQELSKFVPQFKVVPYWGNASDRKVLRKFWSARNQDLHTESSSFHVVVTSYQLVIQDVKYFQRIKWQYMVLDEAQAIKSTSSQRWKILLGFTCRNRLLLTGTPIQNAMQELWGLLHFIMPYLFDSHQEFNEWFSKDIESHAENKTVIDEKHLSRLHMILKPFMLRRIKKDVENELSDKIEIRVDCPLTQRQKIMCRALKKKIRIEDLMQSTGLDGSSQAATSATTCLMNIVMQFRKVCNHPDLFEREDVRSPLFIKLSPSIIPKTFFDSDLFIRPPYSKCRPNIWHPGEVHAQSQPIVQRPPAFPQPSSSTPTSTQSSLSSASSPRTRRPSESPSPRILDRFHNAFEFVFLTGLSAAEVSKCFLGSRLDRLLLASQQNTRTDIDHYRTLMEHPRRWHGLSSKLPSRRMVADSVLKSLLFAVYDDAYCFDSRVTITPVAESPAHYEHRVRKANEHLDDEDDLLIRVKVEKVRHKPRPVLQFRALLPPPHFMNNCLMSACLAAAPGLSTSHNRGFRWLQRAVIGGSREAQNWVNTGYTDVSSEDTRYSSFITPGERLESFGIAGCRPSRGWSHIVIPSKERLVTQSGKLHALDDLLKKLNTGGHRVLIYSQMTRMIDLLEEFMIHRKYIYIRLDGSSRISDRRDMVNDFQERADIFVFLLSTRAGGLGINLTAADTVIFYDSDWNPTVDQQAMDRAHRLGQTKQVTVYRLICQGSIEERILERAREKSEIQRMVMRETHMRPQDALKPKEVVSLLLDDEELERKFRQKQEERRLLAQFQAAAPTGETQQTPPPALTADSLMNLAPKRKRNNRSTGRPVGRPKRIRPVEEPVEGSVPVSPTSELSLNLTTAAALDDDRELVLVVDEDFHQQQQQQQHQQQPLESQPKQPTRPIQAKQHHHQEQQQQQQQQQTPQPTEQQQPKHPSQQQHEASPSSKATFAKSKSRSPKGPTPKKKRKGVVKEISLNNTNQKAARPSSAVGSVGLPAGNVVLDVDVSDPVFAWNDLNLDNLEEIDVNDIDLSTLENVKV